MEKEIIIFIEEKLGYEVSNIDNSFDEIGVDGIDAETFFSDFSDFFDVDMEKFEFERYFVGENPFKNLIRKRIKYWNKKKDFSIQHLVDVAELKVWFDP